MAEKTNLNEIIRKIQSDSILLPDFQRGFVWKDEEMQKKLVASVLTKMPLGSILLLKANAQDYGYKLIGRTTKKTLDASEDKEVQVLLDGQQRLTVLTNIFSNIIFCDLTNYRDELVSPSLKKQFFIKIPLYKDLKDDEDFWGVKNLMFPLANPETDCPKFLTGDILNFIEALSFTKGDNKPYNPKTNNNIAIDTFCVNQECYYIPLYLLIEDQADISDHEIRLKKILKNIVGHIVTSMMDEYDQLEKEQERAKFLQEHVQPQYSEEIKKVNDISYEGIKEKRAAIEQALIDQGTDLWEQRIGAYLKSCINKMDLHQIVVEKSDRDRAIDIYENLNLGGVTLSTFDLILAKASKNQDTYHENLYDRIVNQIKVKKEYNTAVLPELLDTHFHDYVKRNSDYSASGRMKCYLEEKKEISKKYTDAFLNVLSLKVYKPEYDVKIGDLELIKRKKILELEAKDINSNCEKVCEGLDRACFFFQTRCGLRTINELSYNLMFVLVGYLFTNDAFYGDKQLHKRLEAWYWSSIFSGYYAKDQNRNMIKDLSAFLAAQKRKECAGSFQFINDIKKNIFDMPNFSNMSALLLEDGQETRDVVRNGIAQYYLSRTYKDMLNGPTLHIFMDEVEKLELHHIVPLGDMSMEFKEGTIMVRKDKGMILNSPVNFAYVTPKTNKKILSNTIEAYFRCCRNSTLFQLQLDKEVSVNKPEDAKEILRKRAEKVKQDISVAIDNLLGGI